MESSIPDNVALLEQVPLFRGLDRQHLEAIAAVVDERNVKAGTVLTHEGRHEGYFFIIVSGTVRIERAGRTVNTIGPGAYLGEIALLDGGPRTATATTETECVLLSLTHEKFHELLDANPDVKTAVLLAVGRYLRAMDFEVVI